MRFRDLQKKSQEELTKEVEKIRMELMKYKAQVATGGAGKEAGKIRELRRTIAKIKTLRKGVKAKK